MELQYFDTTGDPYVDKQNAETERKWFELINRTENDYRKMTWEELSWTFRSIQEYAKFDYPHKKTISEEQWRTALELICRVASALTEHIMGQMKEPREYISIKTCIALDYIKPR